MLFEASHELEEEGGPTATGTRVRSKSLDCSILSSTSKLKRRLSKLKNFDNCDIFTINENAGPSPGGGSGRGSKSGKEKIEGENASNPTAIKGKIRRSRTCTPAPDITHFPLLLATREELIAATRQKPGRAKSAPRLRVQKKEETEDRAKEHLKDEDQEGGGEQSNKTRRTVRNHLVADSANFREQRHLERQLKGIQSLQRMNISSINKEKLIILQKSKALPSMLYPDVFRGKKPKCTRKGKCFGTGNAEAEQGDSIESGTYLCDPSDGTSPYAEPRKKSLTKREATAAWNNAMHMVLKSKPNQSRVKSTSPPTAVSSPTTAVMQSSNLAKKR